MEYPDWPLISTDSHIDLNVPEAELKARIPARIWEQLAPRASAGDLDENLALKAAGTSAAKGADAVGGVSKRRHRYLDEAEGDRVPPKASSAAERIPFLAIDGVGAEVLFSRTKGLSGVGKTAEAEILRCQLTNDLLYDAFKGHFDRFAPACPIPIAVDIDAAVTELQRIARLGLRPAQMPMHTDHKLYNRPDYDRFWQVANDLQVPLAFHVATGRDPRFFGNPGGAVCNYLYVCKNTIETLSILVCSGILDRFPNLRILFAETEAGWLRWAMECMDRMYVKHQHWQFPKLSMMPSEFVKRQMLVSFMEDPAAIENRHATGVEVLSFGTDFPHHEGTWPHSQDVIAETMEGCTLEEMKQMTHDNAAKLLGFKADTFLEGKQAPVSA